MRKVEEEEDTTTTETAIVGLGYEEGAEDSAAAAGPETILIPLVVFGVLVICVSFIEHFPFYPYFLF